MTLPVLEILPEKARYRVTPASRSLRTRFDGSQGRYRRDYDAAPLVSAEWLLDAPQYDTLVGFYRDTLKNGALAFSIDLIIEDGTPETHTVRVVPGSFTLGGIAGEQFTVRATLEVLA